MVRIGLDDGTIKVCSKCYYKLCDRAGVGKLKYYDNKLILICTRSECEIHNKSNDIKIKL